MRRETIEQTIRYAKAILKFKKTLSSTIFWMEIEARYRRDKVCSEETIYLYSNGREKVYAQLPKINADEIKNMIFSMNIGDQKENYLLVLTVGTVEPGDLISRCTYFAPYAEWQITCRHIGEKTEYIKDLIHAVAMAIISGLLLASKDIGNLKPWRNYVLISGKPQYIELEVYTKTTGSIIHNQSHKAVRKIAEIYKIIEHYKE